MSKLIVTTIAMAAVALSLLVATPASAYTGLCGYFSESRAVNGTCTGKQVQSKVWGSGAWRYGGWAPKGSTSWQAASWASIGPVGYNVR
jgi:hypothetical protein